VSFKIRGVKIAIFSYTRHRKLVIMTSVLVATMMLENMLNNLLSVNLDSKKIKIMGIVWYSVIGVGSKVAYELGNMKFKREKTKIKLGV